MPGGCVDCSGDTSLAGDPGLENLPELDMGKVVAAEMAAAVVCRMSSLSSASMARISGGSEASAGDGQVY